MKNVGKHKRRMLTLVSGFSILSRADHSNSLCDIKGVLLGPLLGLFREEMRGFVLSIRFMIFTFGVHKVAIPYMFASYP